MPKIDQTTVYAYEQDSILKEVAGLDIDLEAALKDKIKNCQKILDEARLEFFNDCAEDINGMEEACASEGIDFLKVRNFALNIQGLAKIFGFLLIENTCSNIISNCTTSIYGDDKKEQIVRKLVDFLKTSLKQKIGLENSQLEISLDSQIKDILKT